jgi:hypothetical protein
LGASGLPFFYYHTQKRTQKRKTPARFLNAAGRKNITPPGAKIFAKALSVFVLYLNESFFYPGLSFKVCKKGCTICIKRVKICL